MVNIKCPYCKKIILENKDVDNTEEYVVCNYCGGFSKNQDYIFSDDKTKTKPKQSYIG